MNDRHLKNSFWHGSKLLLVQMLRQMVWETLNVHRPGNAPDVVLLGSRRSGSTLLMQIIAHASGFKSVNQPFSIYSATSPQMRALGYPAGGAFLTLDTADREAIIAYVQAIKAGSLHVQEPWRFWRKDFHFRSSRLVFKTTDASYLSELLAELGFIKILYFRHPIPQSLSCAYNNWGDKLAVFARHRRFVAEHLTVSQRTLLDELVVNGLELDRYVLCWCLENMPLFQSHSQGVTTVFYEDLVLDSKSVLTKVAQTCGIEINTEMQRMVGQASFSVSRLSDVSTAVAIKKGDKEALIGRWRAKVDSKAIDRIQEILDCFPGCVYRADSVFPTPVATADSPTGA